MRTLPTAEWDSADMAQDFEFWRQTFMEMLFKSLHMA
jgi:hypothetical protein